MTTPPATRAGLLFAVYAGTVLLANLLVEHLGVVRYGPGPLIAPAGAFAAGLALTLRDELEETGGRILVAAAIAAGAGLSFLLSTPALATASAVAFAVSELADWLVYDRLRRSGRGRAVIVSGLVGGVVDSAVFLRLAFGPAGMSFLVGQVVAKWISVAVAGALLTIRRREVLPRHA